MQSSSTYSIAYKGTHRPLTLMQRSARWQGQMQSRLSFTEETQECEGQGNMFVNYSCVMCVAILDLSALDEVEVDQRCVLKKAYVYYSRQNISIHNCLVYSEKEVLLRPRFCNQTKINTNLSHQAPQNKRILETLTQFIWRL